MAANSAAGVAAVVAAAVVVAAAGRAAVAAASAHEEEQKDDYNPEAAAVIVSAEHGITLSPRMKFPRLPRAEGEAACKTALPSEPYYARAPRGVPGCQGEPNGKRQEPESK